MSKVPVFWKKDIQVEMEQICKDISVCGGAVTTDKMDEVFTTVVSDFDRHTGLSAGGRAGTVAQSHPAAPAELKL